MLLNTLCRRLNTQAMHGGIKVCSTLIPALNAGMIENDNITGRDLGTLKQNKEKHLDYNRNVLIPLKAAKYSNA